MSVLTYPYSANFTGKADRNEVPMLLAKLEFDIKQAVEEAMRRQRTDVTLPPAHQALASQILRSQRTRKLRSQQTKKRLNSKRGDAQADAVELEDVDAPGDLAGPTDEVDDEPKV